MLSPSTLQDNLPAWTGCLKKMGGNAPPIRSKQLIISYKEKVMAVANLILLLETPVAGECECDPDILCFLLKNTYKMLLG